MLGGKNKSDGEHFTRYREINVNLVWGDDRRVTSRKMRAS